MDVKVYARYLYDRAAIDQTIFEWFPTWWNGQKSVERWFSLAAFAAIFAEVLNCVVRSIMMIRKTKNNPSTLTNEGTENKTLTVVRYGAFMFLKVVVLISFLSWLFTSPLHRYGYAFVLTLPLLLIGNWLDLFQEQKVWLRVLSVLCVGAACIILWIPSYRMMKDDILYLWNQKSDTSHLVKQKDYPNPSMLSEDLNGITIYYPEEAGGQSWYYAFPATNFGENIQYWENRGDSVEDGFRHVN